MLRSRKTPCGNHRQTSKQIKGFSLIEVIITLAIISILAAISLPSYFHYLSRANRFQAESLLSQLSVALENYFIENQTYEGADITQLPVDISSLHSNYEMHLTVADVMHYTLTAAPINRQEENDTACGTLSLNETGERMISGSASIEYCW